MSRSSIAQRRAQQAARVRQTAENGGVAPIEVHGYNGYTKWGCRCKTCRDANRSVGTKARAERYRLTAENGGVAPVEVHGASTYNNWGCRCDVCIADHVKRMKAQKAARRARERSATGRE